MGQCKCEQCGSTRSERSESWLLRQIHFTCIFDVNDRSTVEYVLLTLKPKFKEMLDDDRMLEIAFKEIGDVWKSDCDSIVNALLRIDRKISNLNQCDGCRGMMPVCDGFHKNDIGNIHMSCSSRRYAQKDS